MPVRFFGTYNFTWIESQRNLMAFDQGCQDDLPSKGNTKVCTVPSRKDHVSSRACFCGTIYAPADSETLTVSLSCILLVSQPLVGSLTIMLTLGSGDLRRTGAVGK